ncbi:hypothetical protein FBR03_10960 [Betaproteobacteria bacterium PRO1]|nr:hypothetical protein [Betaproteobacteria bacterium PRO1]
MQAYELFEVLAERTWRSIKRFGRNRIHFGEDTITSLNLDALASARPTFVFAEDTRAAESTKGCDFELWIGAGSIGWRRYAVQAKKGQFSSGRYGSLAHEVGGTPQIELLERYATANRALPIYCFYNWSDRPYRWNCSLPDCAEQLGCSVAPLPVVRRALEWRGGRTFDFLHSQVETLPWRCLVRCRRFTQRPSQLEPPAERGAEIEAPYDDKSHHNGWPDPAEFHYRELPRSLRALREHGAYQLFDDESDLFNTDVALRPRWVGVIEVPAPADDGEPVA